MPKQISDHYRVLNKQEAEGFSYDKAWLDPAMPELQYERVVKHELAAFKRGEDVLPYRVLLECLGILPIMEDPSLLDIGASSGYYREVIRIGGFPCRYTAVDFSPHYKALAEKLFWNIVFDVADARELPYPDNSFDIVLSSACIMHIREYEQAIREAIRVAEKFIIFHRTPINVGKPSTMYEKEAYGIKTLEWRFDPEELLDIFNNADLKLRGSMDLFMEKDGSGHRTYLLTKQQ
jgi:SAM-dependent methyltransferase